MSLPNSTTNNDKILIDIQSLQKMEQELLTYLENTPPMTIEERTSVISKMNQLSTMRVNLYGTLSDVNTYFGSALNTSVGSLKEQQTAIKIVEDELNRSKMNLDSLNEDRNNKIRLVEINTYYSDKYAESSKLMKVVVFTLIPIIILTVVYNKGILPNSIYYILISSVAFIGVIFFWKIFSSMVMRDNMNYQEYNWGFNPNKAAIAPPDTSTPSTVAAATTLSAAAVDVDPCVGDECCLDGMTYDSKLNKCSFPFTFN
jgi:hypothetical protein